MPADGIARAAGMPAQRPMIGIAWMLLAMAMFCGMDAVAKYLSQYYPVPFVVWGRYLSHAIAVAVVVAPRLPRLIRTARPATQIIRSALLTLATFLMVTALSRIPLADANAIFLLIPLIVTALSVPLLGERVGVRRWGAVVVGFAGALIVVRPGTDVFDPWALFALGAATSFSLVQLMTRSLSKDDDAMTTLIYTSAVGAVVCSFVVPFTWPAPDAMPVLVDWIWILCTGVFGAVGHFALIKAMQHASASTISPFTNTGLIWAVLLGLIVFGDFPDVWTFAGAAIIVGSGLYIWHRERMKVRVGRGQS